VPGVSLRREKMSESNIIKTARVSLGEITDRIVINRFDNPSCDRHEILISVDLMHFCSMYHVSKNDLKNIGEAIAEILKEDVPGVP
jgi:hypothetical protein